MSSAELFGNSTQQPRNPFLLGATLNNSFVNTIKKPSVNTSWIPLSYVQLQTSLFNFCKVAEADGSKPIMLV